MSNICIELGRIPPVGTPLFFKVGAMQIDPPEGREEMPTAMWNVTAGYPMDANAALVTFPQGFAIAFSVSADELPSAAHGAVALSRYFNLDPQRILSSDDPLAEQIPDLNVFLMGDAQVPGQQGTGLRQPAVSHQHTMPWFSREIVKMSDLALEAPPAPEAPAPPALVVAPEEPEAPSEPLQLEPGALTPLTPIKVAQAPVKAPKKPAARKSRKKSTPKVKAVAASS